MTASSNLRHTIVKTAYYVVKFIGACLILCISSAGMAYEHNTRTTASYAQWAELARYAQLRPQTVYAISLAESGREINGQFRPHPYAIGIGVESAVDQTQHESLYFDSREQAEAKLNALIEAGHTNVGVGLMQFNLKHNGHLIDDPTQLFDVAFNLAAVKAVFDYCTRHETTTAILSCYATGRDDSEFGLAYAERVLHYEQQYSDALLMPVKNYGTLSITQFLAMQGYQVSLVD